MSGQRLPSRARCPPMASRGAPTAPGRGAPGRGVVYTRPPPPQGSRPRLVPRPPPNVVRPGQGSVAHEAIRAPIRPPPVRGPAPVSLGTPRAEAVRLPISGDGSGCGGAVAVGKATFKANVGPAASEGGSNVPAENASESLAGLTLNSGDSGEGGGVDWRGSSRGSRQADRALLMTRPEGMVKQGQSGQPFPCSTNYFRLLKKPNWELIQYRVDMVPEEDRTFVRKALVRQHVETLGRYIFDGTLLFTANRYSAEDKPLVLCSKRKEDEQIIQITIRKVGAVSPYDLSYIHVMNIIGRGCLEKLELQLIGRNYYDPKGKVNLTEFKLELWPGYVASMRRYENEILLNCEISNKVLRTDTVMDQMRELMAGDKLNGKYKVTKCLLGIVVLTRYNNKTYTLDDVDWEKNPLYTFKKKDGTEVTFVKYYEERYGLKIRDHHQPLLVSMPKKSEMRSGMRGPVFLVPELCYMTGLSDEQRANFRLMKALGEYTRQVPEKRIQSMKRFSERLSTTPEIQKELKSWGLEISNSLEQVPARLLKPEIIFQKNEPQITYQADNADWGSSLRNFKLCQIESPVSKWIIVYPERDLKECEDFAGMVMKTSAAMGYMLPVPVKMKCASARPHDYMALCNKVADQCPDLVMAFVPNNKSELYTGIKKLFCVDRPVPSQVITVALLKKQKGLMSVGTKVALQIATKMGCEPWRLKIPLSGTMVVGYDTYHDTLNRNLSVGGFVATMNGNFSRFSSSCTIHGAVGQELFDQMKVCFANAIRRYKECMGCLPMRIIVYRDGVGEGQLCYVKEHEIAEMKKIFKENNFQPEFAYIIVCKRVNTRFFKIEGQRYSNPCSGSVVDDVVTLPERHDFYLVSQSVRQGTVNPTYYNVIENTTVLKPDHLQQLTYKLCHLYYNWSGTVRVPSVCQYAHKLAFLVGNSIHQFPSHKLDTRLYYL